MDINSSWVVGPEAWAVFVKRHPELGYRPGRWQFHNFLRLHKASLLQQDAIRLARRRFWIGHLERFAATAFECATGADPLRSLTEGVQP
jgi:hypothetical protein